MLEEMKLEQERRKAEKAAEKAAKQQAKIDAKEAAEKQRIREHELTIKRNTLAGFMFGFRSRFGSHRVESRRVAGGRRVARSVGSRARASSQPGSPASAARL